MSNSNIEQQINESGYGKNPITKLKEFLGNEKRYKDTLNRTKMSFIGYVLDISFETAHIITADAYKISVGGVPRGSFLIMVPDEMGSTPLHFSLLRVKGVSDIPLKKQVQETYFELHKKSMPELDVWTQAELQWGALECDVLGMFYANPNDLSKLEFSGDVNNIISAHRYNVYAPNKEILDLIVNGIVSSKADFEIGKLRPMECLLSINQARDLDISVKISMDDFKGKRTAMFGKTRLGKSNVVKLIAQGMIDKTRTDKTVGQLIFDINGEYANDNSQDDISIRSANKDLCHVFALTKRDETPSEPLRLNFYEFPLASLNILIDMLRENKKESNYIKSFMSVDLPDISDIKGMPYNERTRAGRKIMLFWAILNEAGYSNIESKLQNLIYAGHAKNFDPHYNEEIREAVYGEGRVPAKPSTFIAMCAEFKKIGTLLKRKPEHEIFEKIETKFDVDDKAMLAFLVPKSGSGTSIIQPYKKYHDPNAGEFVAEILKLLDKGQTVILDLGSAGDEIRRYFSNSISTSIFHHQENKFVSNSLTEHYVQLYFEEAHNLFPINDKDITGVYTRFAKEGAKFHIGMVYSTQSPSTINKELLAQTENFFVGHLSSQDETRALVKMQIAFDGVEKDILRARTPGYMRMLTMSNRFVIPVQAKLYVGKYAEGVENGISE